MNPLDQIEARIAELGRLQAAQRDECLCGIDRLQAIDAFFDEMTDPSTLKMLRGLLKVAKVASKSAPPGCELWHRIQALESLAD